MNSGLYCNVCRAMQLPWRGLRAFKEKRGAFHPKKAHNGSAFVKAY